jgi:hypothetical protein
MNTNNSTISKFIRKYNLSKTNEVVKIDVADDSTKCSFMTPDKNNIGIIRFAVPMLPIGSYGVYSTADLLSMLKILGNDITIEVEKYKETAIALNMTDGKIKSRFVLADLDIIPKTPSESEMPPFDLTINIDKEFCMTFEKIFSAIKNCKLFAIVDNKDEKTVDIVMNYSTENMANLNTAVFKATLIGTKPKGFPPMIFSADFMRLILSANDDADKIAFQVSTEGIARAVFVDNDKTFSAKYYLISHAQ